MKNCNIFTAKPISLAIITIIQYPRNNLTGSVAKEQNKSDHLLIRAYLPLSSFFPEPSNLVSFGTKEEKVISTFAPSRVPIRRQPFIANFILLVPLASIPAVLQRERGGRKRMSVL